MDSSTREIKHFINGQFVGSKSGKTFNNVNPINGQIIAKIHEGGSEEINYAVAAARAALAGEWDKLPLAQRLERLNKVAEGIHARFEEFVEAECSDTGKPYTLGRFLDVPKSIANLKVLSHVIKDTPVESLKTETPDGKGALNYSIRAPKGVVALICPWNAPLLILSWKVGPALACGNTVVVKPSEETPTSATLLGEVMNEAGIPQGVYNVVHGYGPLSAGAHLIEHPGIDAITFTGQSKTGSAIMKSAAVDLHDISLELGGKNPAIVFSDCDMNKAIEGTMRSVFANCGQVCLATERIYVERPIFNEFVKRLKAGAESLKLGDPKEKETTMGPLISQAHREKVHGYYQKAKELGANLITGGGIPNMPGELANGSWIEPTIWTGLPEDSPIVKEEIFGPCCHVQPFDTEEEVIGLANDTPYGLSCVIWTENPERAKRVAAQMDAGSIWVNSWSFPDLRTPFGGMKESGIGREGGHHSLEFFTEVKNVCIKL